MIDASISIGKFYNVLVRHKLIFAARSCNRSRCQNALSYTPPSASGDTHAVSVVGCTPLQYSLDSDCVFYQRTHIQHPPTIANRAALSGRFIKSSLRIISCVSRAKCTLFMLIKFRSRLVNMFQY